MWRRHGVTRPRTEPPAVLLALAYQHLLDSLPRIMVGPADNVPPAPQQPRPQDEFGAKVHDYREALRPFTLSERRDLDKFLAFGERPADRIDREPVIRGGKLITAKTEPVGSMQKVSLEWSSPDGSNRPDRTDAPESAPTPEAQPPTDGDADSAAGGDMNGGLAAGPPRLRPMTSTHPPQTGRDGDGG